MANRVTLTFAGDAKQLSRTFDKVNGDANKLQRNLANTSKGFARGVGKVAKGVAIGVGVGAVALAGFGLSAIEAGEALNSIRSQTDAVVKSTKGIANVSAAHVREYSQELSNLAAVDRKVIESSQNVLLTFTNVRNEVGKGNDIFDQGSLAALNMSAALGQDLQSATTMVGKALNDPIQGINAMSRAGIQFTEQQKDQIKTMVESGDILGAQKVILGELETQFAGSAAANADASDKIKLAFQRITEEIGLKLLPHLDRFADWMLNDGIPAMERFAGWVGDEVVPKLQAMAGWVGDNVVPVLKELGDWITGTAIPALSSFTKWLGRNQDVLVAVGIGVAAVLIPAFVAWAVAAASAAAATLLAMAPLVLLGVVVAAVALVIIRHWDDIRDFVVKVASAIWEFVREKFVQIKDWVGDRLSDVVGFFADLPGRVTGFVTSIKDWVVEKFTEAKDWVAAKIEDIVGFFTGLPGRTLSFVTNIKDHIVDVFTQAKNWVGQKIDEVVTFFVELPGRVLGAIASIFTGPGGIKGKAGEAKDAVSGRIGDIVGFFTGLPGRIASALSGLVETIVGPFRTAFNQAKEIWNKITGLGSGGPGKALGGSVGKRSSGGRSLVQSRGGRGLRSFHSGGIFRTNSPRREGPALLQDGEGVFTRSQMAAIGRGISGGGGRATAVEVHFTGNGGMVEAIRHEAVIRGGGDVQVAFGR